MKKYTNIRAPVLAIYAVPPHPETWLDNAKDPAVRAAAEVFNTQFLASLLKQAKAFEEGVPNARVVRLRRANHLIFLSNEVDVLREVRAFLKTLK
jgi:non-heme chloroperoxidase